jgi:adenosine deaminase
LPLKKKEYIILNMITNEIIKRLPKVELHHHLDGAVRPSTIIELAKKYDVTLPETDSDKLADWFHRGADRKNLALYLEGFNVVLTVMQTEEALKRIARENMEDLAEHNVAYAEIRFAPELCINQGLNLESVVEAVLDGLKEGKEKTGVSFGLILCAMRDQQNSLEIAELAVSFRTKGVVGFDIAGDEHGHPPKKHLEAFHYIQNRNFNITIHAGEAFGVESIWQSIQVCGAHRIGHGTRLLEDMSIKGTHIDRMGTLSHFIRDRRIPLEVCLSSNVQTGAAESIDEHPFIIFYRNNFRVLLCSDNPLMSNTTITKEHIIAAEHYHLGMSDFEKLTINAMKSAFAHYDERVRIIYDVLKPGFKRIKEEIHHND